jgi:hypothetical protein
LQECLGGSLRARLRPLSTKLGDSENGMTFYEVLGIPPSASPGDIRSAHRDLAKRYHPDRLQNASPEEVKQAEIKFTQIQQAYETLSENRAEYDQQLRAEAGADSPAPPEEPAPPPASVSAKGAYPAPVYRPPPPDDSRLDPWVRFRRANRYNGPWITSGLFLLLAAMSIGVRLWIYYTASAALYGGGSPYIRAQLAAPLPDQFNGFINNDRDNVSAALQIAFDQSAFGSLSGCMTVTPPFSANGRLTGHSFGSYISFGTKDQTQKLSFSGRSDGENIAGTYHLERSGAPEESGTFTLVKVRPDGSASSAGSCSDSAGSDSQ